ncbi:hypothetical protein H9P43_009438 [Blastocladiella emersonii ATCC 22665]|nr:hypothetical protein H9P43_009438 [Blastocladiella emersonii ATCC 22665]
MWNQINLLVFAVLAIAVQSVAASWMELDTALSIVGMARDRSDYVTTGRCVDFSDATANGVSAMSQLWACSHTWDGTGSPHEHRVGYDTNSGWAWIRHRFRGVDYCLDVPDGNANGSKAQAWYIPTRAEGGPIRSDLNTNLCLDPDQGFNDDRNGQKLKLWHCHGGREQQFALGKLNTNGLPEMKHWCSAKNSSLFKCHLSCSRYDKWAYMWFDGVTYSCGFPYGTQNGPVCVSSLNPMQHQHENPPKYNICGCECYNRKWRTLMSVGSSPATMAVVGSQTRAAALATAHPTELANAAAAQQTPVLD